MKKFGIIIKKNVSITIVMLLLLTMYMLYDV